MNDKKRIALKVVSYATPYPLIARVFQSVSKSGKAIAEAIPARKQAGSAEAEADVCAWSALSPQEKFQKAFVDGQWTEEALVRQYAAFRAAKFVQLVVGFSVLPLVVLIAMYAPWWVVMFGAPAIASFGVVLLAQSLRHAWWQCQIEQRSMMTFKEFVGRDDVFQYLFA